MGAVDDDIEQSEQGEGDGDRHQSLTVDAQVARRGRPVFARHGDRPRLEVAPDAERHGTENHVDAERRQQLVGQGAALQKAEDAALQRDAQETHDDHCGDEADEEMRAELSRDHIGHEAAQHDELAVGEVDDPVDAEDEGEPRRGDGEIHAVGGTVDQLLNECSHGVSALPLGTISAGPGIAGREAPCERREERVTDERHPCRKTMRRRAPAQARAAPQYFQPRAVSGLSGPCPRTTSAACRRRHRARRTARRGS